LTFDAPKTRLFLDAIRFGISSVTAAAEAAGVTRAIHYKRLKADPQYAAAFHAAWEEGHERRADLLEELAYQHVLEGVAKPVVYKGELSRVWNQKLQKYEDKPLTILEWDHTLLWNLLKAAKPDRYRDRSEVSGPNGGPVEATLKVVFVDAAAHAERSRVSGKDPVPV
jgi:hypothetical protein